ncbi:MAG TPA: Asp-tRNA(Asn)/Glu-tRNA(Gln) amidotransferase subunit GatC [Candidatus Paceibacterota bacterium]|jgi:aspartyl-tRNA(Asn)/glutamyl-tRNA(Gln) amidotransferase subunit C
MASVEDVKKLAALARLSIPEETLTARAAEFDRVVAYIAQLDELHIKSDGVPVAPAHRNVFRKDGEPTPPGTWTEKLVGMFPKRDGDHLSVKKILSQD